MFNYTQVTYKSLITRFGLWLNKKLTKKYGMDYYNHVLNYSVTGMYDEISSYSVLACVTVLCLFQTNYHPKTLTCVYGPYYGKDQYRYNGPLENKQEIGNFLFEDGQKVFNKRDINNRNEKEI